MRSILVVDDDRASRATLAAELRSLGEGGGKKGAGAGAGEGAGAGAGEGVGEVEVHEASGGGEALRMLGARAYDVLVLDLRMPLIDGWVVLRALRSKPGPNKKTPVYVITADTSEGARAQAMAMGVVFFMTKPIAKPTLRAVLSGELRRIARRAEEDEERGPKGRAKSPLR